MWAYEVSKNPEKGHAGGFEYEKVPHITLESIAMNMDIDAITEKYQPEIDAALALLNEALGQNWREWEVPREEAEDWPEQAKEVHRLSWELKRKKRQEIEESIRRNVPSEDLRHRPTIRRGVVRVSGPFTVEAIPSSG
ncbi:MAG: hypothetical protein H5T95_09665 [Firmicutes bacterium]|nr:hypothetical protein [Bacillota bacterium]